MKILPNTSLLLFAFAVLATVSCNKDDDATPIDLTKYFNLKSYEVGLVPEQRTVQVLFQVTDFYQNGVPALTVEDFFVSENNGQIDSEANLRLGKGNIPFSLRTVLLLDVSRSVESFIPQIKEAAKTLIEQKLPEQEIAIYTFDSGTTAVQEFTTSKTALLAAIEGLPSSGLVNSTNLYGAVIDVAGLWEDAFSIDGIVDGSLILFTDGRHNATQQINLQDALNGLGTRRAYVAALASPDLDEAALQAIAAKPDRYFKADDVAGLETMFLDIQADIQGLSNSIYFLYYQSPITDPAPFLNQLSIEVRDNLNGTSNGLIIETFNSAGFGG